ncbi:hypothetical protein [Latilactobacillus fuchuensis]|jgi:hypothetical protein|uniref:Uncharacterized protein n=2 Tax=Latilactobacillus fuchuensis TaxID=164393 RepID=A0A2N9DY29_9LACO|nr:hypothetical protein [Latilactobacillus fuchuensis]KRL58586.1 hypothetical protein FC69_GL000238 [Latilactobacillus fuchuensis DSM 14340 = JCM 11249]MCP8857405.1 hypothetical protein [Latilactobacillus fuchuensis]SPC39765.1 conserved hypothetical protein [Latilactobacillus fuchuensis]
MIITQVTDVYGITHENCKVIETENQFTRIFLAEGPDGTRYTCLLPDAKPNPKSNQHFEYGNPADAPY